MSLLLLFKGGAAPKELEVTPGSYAVTGSSVTLLQGNLLAVTPGAYSVTGSNATLQSDRVLSVTPGSYAVTGSSVDLTYTGTIQVSWLEIEAGAAAAVLEVTPGSYSLTGSAVELEVTRTGRPQVGGGKKRRVRLTIDGEEFSVRDAQEAQALLLQARQVAEERAQTALERANKAKGRRKTEILKDARKALPTPRIEVDDQALQALVEGMLGEITALYRSTLQTIEISALLRRVEQDEEDALLAMLL